MRETTTAHGWDRVWDNWYEAQRTGTGGRLDVSRETMGVRDTAAPIAPGPDVSATQRRQAITS